MRYYFFAYSVTLYRKRNVYFRDVGNELQCWFCLSDDHNLGDCNAEHAGGIVTCSDDPHSEHYGDKCGVGHTG